MSEDKIPIRNQEGYLDLTAHDALTNVLREQQVAQRDEIDTKTYRLFKMILVMLDLMGYDLLNRIEIRERESGRVYR